MKYDRTCSFFGHRNVEVTDQLYAATKAEIQAAIELGCRTFYFGGYGDFDGWYKSIYFRNCTMIDQSDVVFFTQKNDKASVHKSLSVRKEAAEQTDRQFMESFLKKL